MNHDHINDGSPKGNLSYMYISNGVRMRQRYRIGPSCVITESEYDGDASMAALSSTRWTTRVLLH